MEQIPNQIETPRGRNEAYLQILGLDRLPASSEGMPTRFFLPAGTFGTLEPAILETMTDDLERSQSISYNSIRGFVPGRLFTGTHEHSGLSSGLEVARAAFFGRKGFLNFHTHPNDSFHYFSFGDILHYRIYNKGYLINVVGARTGISALLKTEKTLKMPFSSTSVAEELEQRLKKLHVLYNKKVNEVRRSVGRDGDDLFMELALKYAEGVVRTTEDAGFAYYSWLSPDQTIKLGDLQNGIELVRVLTDPRLIKSYALWLVAYIREKRQKELMKPFY